MGVPGKETKSGGASKPLSGDSGEMLSSMTEEYDYNQKRRSFLMLPKLRGCGDGVKGQNVG